MEKKLQIKDKVELERKIDEFLKTDAPLYLFTEIYKLTHPQFKLFVNRAFGYSKQTEKIEENSGYTDSYSSSYLDIPHNIEEKYPLQKYEQRELLIRYNELKELIDELEEENLNVSTEKIESLKNELRDYEKYSHDIDKIAHFLNEMNEIVSKNGNIDNFQINYLLAKCKINSDRIVELSALYESYNKCLDDLKKAESNLVNQQERRLQLKSYKKELDEIKEKLVLHNIKLVNWCIRKFFNGIPLPKEDTQMVGIEGLIRAIDGFNPNFTYINDEGNEEHTMFSTYAVKAIVSTIQRNFEELYAIDWKTYIQKDIIKYYRRIIGEIDDSKSFITAEQLVSTGLVDFSERKIKELDKIPEFVSPFSDVYSNQEESLIDETSVGRTDFPVSSDEYDSVDKFQDETSQMSETDIDEIVSNNQLKKDLIKVLDTLTDRERDVIKLRFGLYDGKIHSLGEVAKVFGVTRERIRQIENKAIRKLRHPARARIMRDYHHDIVGKTTKIIDQYYGMSEDSRAYLKLIELFDLNISLNGMVRFLKLSGIDWDSTQVESACTSIARMKQMAEIGCDCEYIKKNEKLYIHPIVYEEVIRKFGSKEENDNKTY